jgi:transcriptional regulator with XRE-family HTH domain
VARWKPLPEKLDPLVVELVVQLRRMKDESGLSLHQVAHKTGYSESSWEQYLYGRALVPWEALQALLELAGADSVAMSVRYETAQRSWKTHLADGGPKTALEPGREAARTAGPRAAGLSAQQRPAACSRLSEELQSLRGRTGLSLAALAKSTPFSKSSWARYLSGKALPPWQAVQALCALAGEPEPRLRILWRVAEEAWSGRGAVSAATPGPEGATPRPRDPVPKPSRSGLSEPGGWRLGSIAALLIRLLRSTVPPRPSPPPRRPGPRTRAALPATAAPRPAPSTSS